MSSSKKILIIDDDLDFIETTQLVLSQHGYLILTHTDNQDAVSVVKKLKPDLVLLDVIFPENPIAGFEVCRDLKSDPATKHIPIVILSAINQKFNMAFTATIDDKKSIPADDFLEKPVDPEQLVEIVEQYVGK